MRHRKLLITGGAGFVGAHIAIGLKMDGMDVIAMDNCKRRGSELNLPRLQRHGVRFVHGDVRNMEDLEAVESVDVIIDCSAEPSAMAGFGQSPRYVINTNLFGTVNCLEFARRWGADFIFLSTSRVYPYDRINRISYSECGTRFEIGDHQKIAGVTPTGISEAFPLDGPRTLYGASKLCSEHIIQEYAGMYGIRAVINRCGTISGPFQFGKIDQGVVALWTARHIFREPLQYIGFGGEGKQVRDVLHVDDLHALLTSQLKRFDEIQGSTFNVGGGRRNSISLRELTLLCEKYTGYRMAIQKSDEQRQGDIRLYITDHSRVSDRLGWYPEKGCEAVVEELAEWISENRELLHPILSN